MRWLNFMIVMLGTVGVAVPVTAEVLEIAPVEVVGLPEEQPGVARVAVRFGTGALPQTPSLRITGASLEWSAGSLNELPARFWVESIDDAWTREGVETGAENVSGSQVLDEWEITPPDHARNGGLVRLDLDATLSGWLAQPQRNYGVVLASPSLAQDALATQAGTLRLVVRYSLVRKVS